jgi:hypothetical protein
MGEWGGQTPWRQGHILPDDAIDILFPKARRLGFDVALVISHDCDLAQLPGAEPRVEIILGKWIDKLDGNYSFAKNARRLHLSFTNGDAPLHVDILTIQKTAIEKKQLADFRPYDAVRLTPEERSILQRWLSMRYRRSAFPDEFNRRLESAGVRERLVKILRPLGSIIVAMYVDIDKGEEVNREGEDDPYNLLIYLLYTVENDLEGLEKAQATADSIGKLFRDKFYKSATRTWKNVELEGCIPISDQAMTYAESVNLTRWNADYISLHADPPQPVPPD